MMAVRMGGCVCDGELCMGSSFLATWDESEKFVRCPLCNTLVKVPDDSRSFPSGRCNSCNEPLDDPRHVFERNNGWRLVFCMRKV